MVHGPQVGIDTGMKSVLKFLVVDFPALVWDVGVHAGDYIDLGVARIVLNNLQVSMVQLQLVSGTGMTEGVSDYLGQP